MYSTSLNMSEGELYDGLLKYLLPENNLEEYGYPTPDPHDRGLRKRPPQIPVGKDFASFSGMKCERCRDLYPVNLNNGMPVMGGKGCRYHRKRSKNGIYDCCSDSILGLNPCRSHEYHIIEGEHLMANYKGFVETQLKPEREPNEHGIYPIKCEMCYTTVGKELTRVTVLDHKLEVVYEKLVKPNYPILDYRTHASSLRKGDLDNVTTTIDDVHRDLLELFSSKSILVGHSLENDMLALKLFHKRFIDTSRLYVKLGPTRYKYRLADLKSIELGEYSRNGSRLESKEDAVTAFRLVLKKLNES